MGVGVGVGRGSGAPICPGFQLEFKQQDWGSWGPGGGGGWGVAYHHQEHLGREQLGFEFNHDRISHRSQKLPDSGR